MLLSSVTKVEICVIVNSKEDGGGLLRPQGGGEHTFIAESWMVDAMQNCTFNSISGLITYHLDVTNSLHKPTHSLFHSCISIKERFKK